jgi:hypothetical protein
VLREATHVDAPAALEARLRRHLPGRAAQPALPPARSRRTLAWLSVAAAVLIALGARMALPARAPRAEADHAAPLATTPPAARTAETPDATVATPPATSARPARVAVQRASASRLRRRRPAAPTEDAADGFMRLPYAEALPESGSLQVMRVQLPRAALVRYGWPAVDGMDARPVNADVMVGDDGFARAIRFVDAH